MKLTQDQIKQNINVLESQGADPKEIQQWLDSLKGGEGIGQLPNIPEEPKQGVFKEMKTRFDNASDRNQENLINIAQRYDEARAKGDKWATPAMALSATAAAPRYVVDLALEGVKQILPDEFKSNMKEWLGSVVNNENVQKDIIQPLNKLEEKNPQLVQAGRDVLDIASVLPAPKGISQAEKLASKGKAAVSGAADDIARGAASTVDDAALKASKVISRSPEEIAASKAAAKAKVEQVAGRIAQGDIQSQKTAAKVLTQLDTKAIKTYDDALRAVDDLSGAIKTKVDDLTSSVKDTFKLKDLKLVKNVAGPSGAKSVVKVDRVNQALKGLKQLYTKTKDPEALSLINQVITKAKTEGIDISMINKIAREWGTQKRAFNLKTGQPLTGINATMYENIRKGLKEVIKQKAPQIADRFTALDKAWSDTITVKGLFSDMVEKISKAEQKAKIITKSGKLRDKAGSAIVTAADVASGGMLKSILRNLVPKGKYAGEMGVLDIQKALRSNLIKLEKLNKSKGENFINKLRDYVGPKLREGALMPNRVNTTKIIDEINSGGITYNILKREAKTAGSGGYGVSVFPNRAFVKDIAKSGPLNNKELAKFMRDNIDILSKKGFNLGGWKDGDNIFLDISKVVADKEKAMKLGKELDQISITDFNGADLDWINTGGTGNISNMTDDQVMKILDKFKE